MAEVMTITVASLSKSLRAQVQALRRPVLDLARQFGAVREKLQDIAPKIVKLYNQIKAEHEAFTFVEFSRLFDASVPTHAADRNGEVGYRNHKTYYTLQYMRRIIDTNTKGKRGQQGVRDSATDGLARTLATLFTVIEDDGAIWNAVQQEFQFGERVMTRLRKRVAATKPLITLTVAKPIKIGKVIHMERINEPEQPKGRTMDLSPAAPPKKRAA